MRVQASINAAYECFLRIRQTWNMEQIAKLYCQLTENIHEYIWGNPPQYGMWEGSCSINGTIKWQGNTVELNGWSMMEFTRKGF